MNKDKLIRKIVATGKRELKKNFEFDYGERDFTIATYTFPKKLQAQIEELLEEINAVSLKQGVPFMVELLNSGTVRFSCLDDNKTVVKTLVKKGW